MNLMPFLLLLSFVSFASPAAENARTKGIKKVEIDINQDGKVDRIETYKNDRLIKVERDSTYNGHMDEVIEFFPYVSPKKPIEIVSKDTNADGKVDRIEKVYRDPIHDLLIVTTEVDSKFTGVFDKKWTTNSKLNQKKDEANCLNGIDLGDSPLLKLSNDVTAAKYSLDHGFYITDWGYKIHQSCLDKWGGDSFPALLKSSMSKGFQCLARLATENSKNNPQLPNGAFNNLKGLEFLLKTSKVSVVCNEKKYDWTGTAAHASASPDDVIKESGVKHPFLSINNNEPKAILKPTKEETDNLSMTLFHEQLHNLGIRHNESIEFPYSCEACCIKNDEGKSTADACKICAGAYTGTTDKSYIKDMIAWGKSSYQKEKAAKAVIKFQKEFPDDRFGIFAYAEASSEIFAPVGAELGKILKQKFTNLTPDEENFITNSQEYADVENLKAASKYSKFVAESHFTLYYEKDKNKVLDQLEKNKETIQELIKKEASAKDNDKYVYGDIKTKLNDLLYSIWLEGYPNHSGVESDRAYKILKDNGIIGN